MSTTAKKASAATTTKADPKSASEDAVVLLTADHKEVKALFVQYDKLAKREDTDAEKQALAERICLLLTVHATAEEELFYPAALEALGDDGKLVDEATVEHTTAKDLIAQLEESSPDEELYDARMKVLSEYIEHHVKEEEGEIFPKAKKAGLDMAALGRQISARKEELMAELGA